jgi:uncharacterized membrane protein YgcG
MAPQIQTGLTNRPTRVVQPVQPQPTLTPVTTPTTTLFLTKLAASKAAGVTAIRLSLVDNGGHQVEELNAKGEVIVGFALYAVGDAKAKKVTGVAVLQVGSGRALRPFSPAQRSAWGLIRNELVQFKASGTVRPPAGGAGTKVKARSDARTWLEVIVTTIDCAGAIVEGGLNPLADAGCVGGVVATNWEINDVDDDPTSDVPVIDIPLDPEPIGPVTSTAPDDPPPPPPDDGGSGGDNGGEDAGGGDGGGGGGGGGDGGPDDDNGETTHKED